jgi:hypothetical protein
MAIVIFWMLVTDRMRCLTAFGKGGGEGKGGGGRVCEGESSRDENGAAAARRHSVCSQPPVSVAGRGDGRAWPRRRRRACVEGSLGCRPGRATAGKGCACRPRPRPPPPLHPQRRPLFFCSPSSQLPARSPLPLDHHKTHRPAATRTARRPGQRACTCGP